MKIPSKSTCYQLIREMEMMDHIVDHSREVCRVALFLVDGLKDREIVLNRDLVEAAALLHDITKTRSFKTKEDHCTSGKDFLAQRGYPEVADIVGQHVKLRAYDPTHPFTEAAIVNYADKRVLHDRVVTLEDRMNYILERYGRNEQATAWLSKLWKTTIEIEKRLFENLPFVPDDLPRLVNHS